MDDECSPSDYTTNGDTDPTPNQDKVFYRTGEGTIYTTESGSLLYSIFKICLWANSVQQFRFLLISLLLYEYKMQIEC